MTTGTTTLLGLALPVQGELSGTWGDTVNNSITSLVDSAIAGTTTLSTDADVTLTTTTLAANQARQAIILWTASGTATRTITVPAWSKPYIVINKTGSTQSIIVIGTSGTGVTLVAGEKAVVAWDGTNFVKISSTVVSGTVPVANGGTGLTSGTSGGILAYTASGVLASSGALTANNVVVGGGAGAAPSSTNLLAISAAVTTGNYIKAIGYADTVTALGNSGTAMNIDVTSGNVFSATLTGNCTFTLRYPVATGSSSFTLILSNDATPSRTVAWAGGTFKFPGGSVSRTTTANAIDIWFFFTPDGGTTWYGSIPMSNLS